MNDNLKLTNNLEITPPHLLVTELVSRQLELRTMLNAIDKILAERVEGDAYAPGLELAKSWALSRFDHLHMQERNYSKSVRVR